MAASFNEGLGPCAAARAALAQNSPAKSVGAAVRLLALRIGGLLIFGFYLSRHVRRKNVGGTASQIWQGRLYFRPRRRDLVAVSFFKGKTDGFETN